jgi:hypothetical protein
MQPMSRTRSVAIVSMMLGTGLVTGLAAGVLAHHLAGTAQARAPQHPGAAALYQAFPQSCSASSAILGYIGELTPGSQASDVSTGSIPATTLTSATGSQSLILLPRQPQDQTGDIPAPPPQAPASSVLQASGVVYAQSSNPQLRSCDYMLAGQPADQPLVSAAEQTLISNGQLPAAAVARVISVYVSDDPLDQTQSIVTVDIRSATGTPLAGAAPGALFYPSSAYAVVESTTSGQATAWGAAPW